MGGWWSRRGAEGWRRQKGSRRRDGEDWREPAVRGRGNAVTVRGMPPERLVLSQILPDEHIPVHYPYPELLRFSQEVRIGSDDDVRLGGMIYLD